MTSAERDEELITKAQNDSREFRVLYELYVEQIFRFIFFRVHNHQEVAEDLTAEVFAKALHALPKFKAQGYPYSTYLYQVARSVCADYYKKYKEVDDIAEVELSDGSRTVERTQDAVDGSMVWEMVKTLPVTLQEIIRLRYVEDLSHEEIGKIVGKSPGAVRTALSRALTDLKKRV